MHTLYFIIKEGTGGWEGSEKGVPSSLGKGARRGLEMGGLEMGWKGFIGSGQRRGKGSLGSGQRRLRVGVLSHERV